MLILGLSAPPEAEARAHGKARQATAQQAKAAPHHRAARPARTRTLPARPKPARAAPPSLPAETAEERRLRVAEAVRGAARDTGFDPDTLVAIAMAESSLREEARNPRSSAAGPLQFTTATWLAAVYGLADRVPALVPHRDRLRALSARELALGQKKMPRAQRSAALRALRREQTAAQRAALALRHDAAIAARVAATLAQEDAERYRRLTGSPPASPGEVYAIHFLGVGVAAALARAARERPGTSIAEVLPPAVLRANREIFLGPKGRPIAVREARSRIAGRLAPPPPDLVEVAEAP